MSDEQKNPPRCLDCRHFSYEEHRFHRKREDSAKTGHCRHPSVWPIVEFCPVIGNFVPDHGPYAAGERRSGKCGPDGKNFDKGCPNVIKEEDALTAHLPRSRYTGMLLP